MEQLELSPSFKAEMLNIISELFESSCDASSKLFNVLCVFERFKAVSNFEVCFSGTTLMTIS